jgi:phosphatidate cytidylyltransferase
MLKQRLQTGFALGGAFLACVFLLPPLPAMGVLLILGGLSLYEFYTFLDARGIPHFKLVGFYSGLALMAGTVLSIHFESPWKNDAETMLLFLATAAIYVRQLFHKSDERPLMTMGSTLLGVFYIAFLFNFFARLLTFWGDETGRFMLLYLVFVVKFTDIGAYFTGCAIGKHKLIPHISPNKTWEGCIGGVLAGIAAGYGVYHFWNVRAPVGMSVVDVVALGFLLSVAGIVGDLIESLLKRAAGLKDSGRMFLGLGGILDVLDSLLFAAPVLYLYARVLMH